MDEKQFTQGVKQYHGLLFHIAYAMLRQEQDCADAVQEALAQAWRCRNRLREEKAFKAWLIRILVNSCHSVLRRRRRVQFTPLQEMEAPPQVDNLALHEALGELPTELRLPLVLFYLEGFTVEEIGKALRVPTGTVKSRMSRGRKLLSSLLSQEE